MNADEAKKFGHLLRQRREHLRLTVRQVADTARIPHSTVARIERGEFAAPRPDKLARLAKTLGFTAAELFAEAGYVRAEELPDLATYLKTKYPKLSLSLIKALTRQVEAAATPANTTKELIDDPAGGSV